VNSGKRALVTGGSGGIGGALCRRLARDGHHVYVHAHRGTQIAASVVGEIRAAGGAASVVSFDITDGDATRAVLEEVLEAGPIQILVNNAGLHDDAVLPGMSAQQWHRVIDVSVNGFFNATQPLLLPMIRTRWGRIVNVSSIAALIGNKGQVNYAAAKGALNSATKALALEVATRGITVNAVAPGIIGTPMTAGLFDAKAIERLVPMNRVGLPEEVAGVVSFLASEDAAYVTAQVISVSGGIARDGTRPAVREQPNLAAGERPSSGESSREPACFSTLRGAPPAHRSGGAVPDARPDRLRRRARAASDRHAGLLGAAALGAAGARAPGLALTEAHPRLALPARSARTTARSRTGGEIHRDAAGERA
jgi:3-oxoacyl-[acyl-carrier protein] reductase